MQNLFFWKEWPRDYRLIWYIALSFFVASIVLVWIYYFRGDYNVISWEKIQEQKVVETTTHAFRLGPFQLSIPSESYVIFEFFGGGELQHNFTASCIFLVVFSFAIMVLLSIITTLDKFWYFAGLSAFIILIIALRLDVLDIFGLSNQTITVGILAIYLSVAYYFGYVKPHTSFLIRLSSFTAITIAVSAICALSTTTSQLILHFVVTTYTPAIFISTLFIIMVAHEILVLFVYITNQGTAGKNAGHFSLISAIYLINIIITYMFEVGVIHWNFLYINLFLLLTLSALLGIWGFRLRAPLYTNILSFDPFGAFLFIALGSICFVTVAQLLGNANDAAIQVIRQTIIYTHAGFGIVFMIYFFSNFLVIMGNNLPVYNLLYRPTRMPYFTFRFAGIIATLAFLFYSHWQNFVDHGIAGFYNYAGDMHWMRGDEAGAQNFYELSKDLSFQNHRANYILGTMKTARANFEGAVANYERANGKRASEFSVANEANLNFWSASYFDALAAYRKAVNTLPHSAIIKNNLGFAYAKLHNLDSASYYFSLARKSDQSKNSAEANFLAMAAMEIIPLNADSVLKYFDSQSAAVQANAIAAAALFKQKIDITDKKILENKQLDLYTATLLNNYINYNASTMDTATLTKVYHIASDSLNLGYGEALKATAAHAYYLQGNVYKALEILGELAFITQDHQGKFNYIMGVWVLEQGSPSRAASYFTHAETARYKDAEFYKAISLTEAGKVNEAIMAWDSLIEKNEQPFKDLGMTLRKILYASPAQAVTFPDAEKYQYCRYRIGLRDTTAFKQILNTFTNDNYKAQALLDLSKKFYSAGKLIPCIRLFNKTTGLELSDKSLYNNLRHFELLMLASRKEINTLAKQINNNISFSRETQLEKMLYTALISEASGDKGKAENIYNVLGTYNPFFEDGILASAEFFKNRDPKSTKPYDLLVNAIYVNPNSIRLLRAYAAEAQRIGFDEYAASASSRLKELEED